MKNEITKERVEQLYTVEGKELKDVAKLLKISVPRVYQLLQKYQITLRKPAAWYLDITNKKYGKLTAIRPLEHRSKRGRCWLVRCDCGKECQCLLSRLQGGCVRSCRECDKDLAIKNTRWKGFGEISGNIWCSISRGAKTRAIDFEITIQEAWDLFLKQDRKCALTDELLIFSNKKAKLCLKETTASLDRIDPTKGYTINNIQWVHKRVNRMKNVYQNQEFIDTCIKVANKYQNHA